MYPAYHHACGGTILIGAHGEQGHLYCETCRAFVYLDTMAHDGDFPSGTDVAANQRVWDLADERSPEAAAA